MEAHEDPYMVAGNETPIAAGHAYSVEPGIYIPGFGGVRLENICLVEAHPTFPNMLKMRPLVYVGFDAALIDTKLLNEEERQQLEEYEAECSSRGTSLRTIK
jgi:Xaa-Pro aminopeptidase